MGLAIALGNALTGLNVNQQALTVLSQNIANANTAGYSRQNITQSPVYLDGMGAGVSIEEITRKVDEYLLKSMRLQNSVASQYATTDDYASRIQLLIGQPGQGDNLSSSVNNFFNTLQALAQTPEGTTQKVNVINTAVTLTRQLQQLSDGLQQLRLQADNDFNAAIDNVNSILSNMRNFNSEIAKARLFGQSTAGLEDKRDLLMNELGQYMDVQTYTKSDGTINVLTGNGVTLLDENLYQLTYTPAGALEPFLNDAALSAVEVVRIGPDGTALGQTVTLVTSGRSADVTTLINSGSMRSLLDMRDSDLPDIISQLDTFTATIRDQMNAIHNQGTGFPGASSYTSTRTFNAQEFSTWSGSMRLSVLDSDGNPVGSPYADETYGLAPLTIDLSALDTGSGAGVATVQGIIDEINQYYGTQQTKTHVGNLNNIRLASSTTQLPSSSGQFTFDFDLENISATAANFYVTDLTVYNSSGTDITSVVDDAPNFAISDYDTTNGSNIVTVTTTLPHGLIEGQRVYLSESGLSIGGLTSSQVSGFFVVSNVTTTGFEITVADEATSGGTTSVVGPTIPVVKPPYSTVESGQSKRTTADGTLAIDLTGQTSSTYYTIKATVAVDDGSGNMKISEVSYRVNNNQYSLFGSRYGAQEASGNGTLVQPSPSTAVARAMLVDANGNELLKINGNYTTQQDGYLKIMSENSSYMIAIDSMDSSENGQPNSIPAIAGTGRGFSHYFDLNNFFVSPDPDAEDTTAGSARTLQVEQRIQNNKNLISLGMLTRGSSSSGSDATPNFTYGRNIGDNTTILAIAELANTAFQFAGVGGLGASKQTLSGYTGSIIGAASIHAVAAKNSKESSETLLQGYQQRASSFSGVNLDTELANTIIYQNAYTASARVITVANELFETLLNTFQ